MPKLSHGACQPAADFSKAFRLGKLTQEHRHEARPHEASAASGGVLSDTMPVRTFSEQKRNRSLAGGIVNGAHHLSRFIPMALESRFSTLTHVEGFEEFH